MKRQNIKTMKNKKKQTRKSKPVGLENSFIEKNAIWMLAGILGLTFLAYTPAIQNGFVWDDTPYLLANSIVQNFNLKDIFSEYVLGNYHPVTIFVLAAEHQLFGLNPKGYHVVAILLHLLNTVLVYFTFKKLTSKTIVALVVTLLFGIHPLHVESVAWIAQLKDLLYTFFFLLSYFYYLKYLDDKYKQFLWISLGLFLLSVLSKAMAVCLPVLLVLTDFYKNRKWNNISVLMEKAPYFIISLLFGILAIFAQEASDAIASNESYTFFHRMLFASYGFINYIVKLILPYGLSPFYPYPILENGSVPVHFYIYFVSALAMVAVIFYSLKNTKVTFFGFGFFIITIFLVLQLLPVGDAIMADRYSYVPSLGIFFILATMFNFLWEKTKYKMAGLGVLILFSGFYSFKTMQQCKVWENELTVWNTVIDQYKTASVAYNNRGMASRGIAGPEEILKDFNKSIALNPNNFHAYNNRGNLLTSIKKMDEAIASFNQAIELNPDFHEAYNNRGVVFSQQNQHEKALVDFQKSVEIAPNYTEGIVNIGISYLFLQQTEKACLEFQKAKNLGSEKGAELHLQKCN